MIDDFVAGGEDAIGEPVLAHVLPDVFDRVQLGTLGRDRDQREVVGNMELACDVPTGLIHQDHGVRAFSDESGDLLQMKRHRLGVAKGEDKAGAFVVGGADGPEDVG